MSKILMYGTPTCGDCVLAKQVFAENNVDYDYIDISNDEEATQKAIELNNGIRRIPVIVFEDQSILVEPNREELLSKLG
ncbi:MAG: glutaredoxin family protein [Candidatus Thermoplasmatota archaeon]|nr:glutaredoxin family protein [Candidatus Thermoplasmatota archaeon]|tara:strand:- start:351 stop:587 length:237 start_codon:yes stop_codon:yes gene_type:complete